MVPRYFSSNDKTDCFGCRACEQVCRADAIYMEDDSEGFMYPVLDRHKCVDCGQCIVACPMENSTDGNPMIEAFAAVHKDESVLQDSSSGGVFTAIAECVLDMDGVVFGAVLENNYVFHHMAETKDELATMRGSKYVQSDLGNTLRLLRKCIIEGRIALFSGTPCQCAAARNIVGDHQERLLTIEVVCHGVPSPGVFSDYVQWLSDVHRSPIRFLGFRAKQKGRIGEIETYQTVTSIVTHAAYDSRFLTGFLRGYFLRPSCYECPYAAELRHSDITMCDFWGCESYHCQLDELKGISGLMVNTLKGREWVERASGSLYLIPTKVENIAAANPNLQKPTPKPTERDLFFKDRIKMSFADLSKKYLRDNDAWKNRITARIPKPIQQILKRLRR